MKSNSIFSYQHKVIKKEIDRLNHVNNVVYVQWIQDIATKHWSILAKNTDLNTKYSWVVVRHEIDYKKQAVLDDNLTIKTWVGETSGVTSIRNVEIFRGDTLIAKAKTTWCLIDNSSLKPTRIKDNILKVLTLQT